MTDAFFSHPADQLTALNQEIEDLYAEVEDLHAETGLLLGLMAGSYAYFLQQLMMAHQTQQSMTPDACEKIIVDALRRILTTQSRLDQQQFQPNLLGEIKGVLAKMSQPIPLDEYLRQAAASQPEPI
ncbi:hypothetical protein [Lyngbya confervoides]|uniref:Uncharacterized protein n=1 Tax=Lyngbya confervoides BDU141951 TaxID=1574623 RepID=A0ABD4T4N4_9CYAN|nr:hypothetical protein [Lyngbya confervoides]MCM1983438.1 hypothetical protein [Lyngbya confervoides BDU141951]